MRREVAPEELELLLQQIAPDRFEVVLEQLGQADLLFVAEVLRSLEQQPAAFGEHRLVTLGLHLPGLLGAHFVDRFAKVGHDVEAIEDVQRPFGFLGDHFQIRFPHVAADVFQITTALFSKPAKEPQQCFDRSLLADPQQPFAVTVDLINQREITMTALPGNLIHTNGVDAGKILVGAAPLDGHLHGTEDAFPRGVEYLCGLLP